MNRWKKKHSALLAALLFAVTALGCKLIDRLKAGDHLNKGVSAFTAKRHSEAVGHFKTAIELDPELTVAVVYLATTYRAQYIPGLETMDNLAMARRSIVTFEEVLERDPSNPTALASIAGIYSQLGDYDRAKEWYNRRVELEPNNPDPLYGIGTIDWQLSYDETGTKGENIENLSEEKIAEINQLVEEAIVVLKKALEIRPDYHEAMQYLNLLYREKAKLNADPEEKRKWELEADKLALQALELKRTQEEEEEKARRTLIQSQAK
jgi:tetratricopeptide (TPR) repeat protein